MNKSIQRILLNFQLRRNERVLIDPTRTEESSAEDANSSVTTNESVGQITVGYQPSLEQIALMSQEGCMTPDHLLEDTKRLTKVCSELVTNVQMCLVDSVKSSAKKENETAE